MEKNSVQATRYLRDREVARVLALSVGHLANLRNRGEGPKYHKFGKSVRYDWREVIAWAEAQKAEMKN